MDYSNDENEEVELSKVEAEEEKQKEFPTPPVTTGKADNTPVESPLRSKDEDSKEFQAPPKEGVDWRWSPPKHGYQESNSPMSNQG